MIDPKISFGVLGVVFGVVRYGLYFQDVFRGATKPHIFSWFVWGLINVIVFFAQFVSGAGPGAWSTALVAVACLSIAVIALFRGEKEKTSLDWFAFLAALVAVTLWVITRSPLPAVITVTLADAIAYIPTYRKSFHKPYEEHLYSYWFAVIRSISAILALDSFALTNWLFPASLVLTDGSFVVMLMIRRRHLTRSGRLIS